MPFDETAERNRRKLRGRCNQMERAVASVELSVDALPLRDRVIVLNSVLRDTLDDWRQAEARAER